MSAYYSFFFQLRIPFTVLAGIFLVSLAFPKARRYYLKSLAKAGPASSSTRQWLVASCLIYFAVSGLSKYTQLRARVLDATDFWLFEDMFRFMAQGLPYITRFAPVAMGPVQHGGLHAFLTIWLFTPFTLLFGSTATALLLIPFAFALAGYLIGEFLAQSTDSKLIVIGLPLSFWMSEWTNRTLLYETHPEALYIPLVFIAYAASVRLYRNACTRNWIFFVAAWLFLAGVKQDAVVYGLLLWAFLLIEKRFRAASAGLSIGIIFGVFALMTALISAFRSGSLGAHSIDLYATALKTSAKVVVDVALAKGGTGNLNGHTLSSPAAILDTINFFLKGGPLAFATRAVRYLFFSQFTLLTLIAPYLWFRRSFWLLVVPFALLIGGIDNSMATLQVYNSVMFISFLWLCVCFEFQRSSPRFSAVKILVLFTITFSFCAIHGGSSPIFYFENELSRKVALETAVLLKDRDGLGVVSGRLLNDVDRDRVWADVTNNNPSSPGEARTNLPDYVKWIIYPQQSPSYEFEQSGFEAWKEWAITTGGWQQISGQNVILMVRP